jgi:hypothetical protein
MKNKGFVESSKYGWVKPVEKGKEPAEAKFIPIINFYLDPTLVAEPGTVSGFVKQDDNKKIVNMQPLPSLIEKYFQPDDISNVEWQLKN